MALVFESRKFWAPTLCSSKPVNIVQELSNYRSQGRVKTQGKYRIRGHNAESLQNFREVMNVEQKS